MTVVMFNMVPMPPFLSGGRGAGGGYTFALCGSGLCCRAVQCSPSNRTQLHLPITATETGKVTSQSLVQRPKVDAKLKPEFCVSSINVSLNALSSVVSSRVPKRKCLFANTNLNTSSSRFSTLVRRLASKSRIKVKTTAFPYASGSLFWQVKTVAPADPADGTITKNHKDRRENPKRVFICRTMP
jgi:hypothetical protein